MKQDFSGKKVALVFDSLTEIGGAEKVLLAVHEIFPEAPIFTAQFREKSAPPEFSQKKNLIKTGKLNFLPRRLRKFISPLRYKYFPQLNFSDFDLILSITNAESKNLKTNKDQLHISYLQGPPTQYYWGMAEEYLRNPGFGKLNFLARFGLKKLLKKMRKIDFAASQKPDILLANSNYSAAEIQKYYNRKSIVLHPPVDVAKIRQLRRQISAKQRAKIREELFHGEDFFVTAGRQVNWKKIDLAISAAKKTGRNLLVIGDGPEHKNLLKIAGDLRNIKFLPKYNGAEEIVEYFAAARGFIFPSLEPFGITPIEALATGIPVLALSQGGARDYIKENVNGKFFEQQTVDSLAKNLEIFAKIKFDERKIARSAEKFSEANFKKNLLKIINENLK